MEEIRLNIDSNETFMFFSILARILRCGNRKSWTKEARGQIYKTADLFLLKWISWFPTRFLRTKIEYSRKI